MFSLLYDPIPRQDLSLVLHEICVRLVGIWWKEITVTAKHPVLSHKCSHVLQTPKCHQQTS